MPPSCERHAPTASKFSSANPSGSITLWQVAQAGFARCSSMRSRIVRLRRRARLLERRDVGGRRRRRRAERFSRIHLPRSDGDVRSACDVTIRMLPLPSRPLRASSATRHAAELAAVDVRNP